MKKNRPQCKDIPELPILEFIYSRGGEWCGWSEYARHDVRQAMPDGTPDGLVLAKMKSLIYRGLIDGCHCGCRGDFRPDLYGKGQKYLDDLKTKIQNASN